LDKLDKVIVPADKSRNFCTCDVPEYRNLRNQNITAEYMKSTPEAVEDNDIRSGEIAVKLKLDDRMQKHSK
jgi:hypothetical protein